MPGKLPLGALARTVRDPWDFRTFLEAYTEKRERNLAHNTQKGTTLTVRGFTVFDSLDPAVYAIPNTERQSRSPFNPQSGPPDLRMRYRPRNFCRDFIRPFVTKIILIERLTPELGCRSPVWIARVDSNPGLVVVKIFQDCFLDEEPWLCQFDTSVVDFWPEEEDSHREAWAYHALMNLQGSYIPHSYGFYDVILPSGDKACIHVMEKLEGNMLEYYIKESHDKLIPELRLGLPSLRAIAGELLQVILLIQSSGVFHDDVHERNFIVVRLPDRHCDSEATEQFGVVMFDFGNARSALEAARPRSTDRSDAYGLVSDTLGLEGAHEVIKGMGSRRKREGCDEFEGAFWEELLEIYEQCDGPAVRKKHQV